MAPIELIKVTNPMIEVPVVVLWGLMGGITFGSTLDLFVNDLYEALHTDTHLHTPTHCLCGHSPRNSWRFFFFSYYFFFNHDLRESKTSQTEIYSFDKFLSSLFLRLSLSLSLSLSVCVSLFCFFC